MTSGGSRQHQGKQPFGGMIGRTYEDSTPWWPPLPSAPDGRAQRRARAARRRRLRPVRLLRLRHRHAVLRPPGRRGAALQQLPHHRAVLPDPGLPAHRTQPPLERRRPRRRPRRRLPRATTPTSRGENGFLSEILRGEGYATFAVGKWHLAPLTQTTMGSPRDKWPLGRGFDRFYGFMEGETDQFHPQLVHDNHAIDPPRTPEEGYHLTEDLADQAIRYVSDLRATAPDQPFFLWFTPGRLPRAAPGAPWTHRALPRALRPGLGRVAPAGVRPAARVRPPAAGHRALGAPVLGAGLGLGHRRRAPHLRAADGGVRRPSSPTPTSRCSGWSTSSSARASSTTRSSW